MRSLIDQSNVLQSGLSAIRAQYSVPQSFPPEVLAAAETAAARRPTEHIDRTDWAFVTLDPATSTDLDQAFTIERAGHELILHYAIADVAWFVRAGDALDAEAWKRGATLYLPDGKAGLYPPVLAEGAASLLPDGPRPAVVFHVRVGTDGEAVLDGAERSIIHSRAKLAYDNVTAAQLPADFEDFARRVQAAAEERGAGTIEPPEQQVERVGHEEYQLLFRPRLPSEDRNAAMSLACNLAVAGAMFHADTGLFRVMPDPDERAVKRLRHTAHGFGMTWLAEQSLAEFSRTLDALDPKHAAFMLAERRAGGGADYQQFIAGVIPWHSAMAATYAHATAPLRRLADRYVVQVALAVANGKPVPDDVAAALPLLPEPMDRADSTGSRIERAVLDLAEAVILKGHEGNSFDAVVVDDDDDGTRIQLLDLAVVAKVKAHSVEPGDRLRVKLLATDVDRRTVQFERVS
ncbi:MAG: RNB domain-containing ribonuclease [Ilumatobacteraceae bacterium]|nr:RNB domain-containing ribonuclease [Ilumatobacteraceae bacterium]